MILDLCTDVACTFQVQKVSVLWEIVRVGMLESLFKDLGTMTVHR